jgi:hypothetical protein
MFKCDEYFEANNVSFIRGIKGLSSGVIMDNIRNVAATGANGQGFYIEY